MNRKTTERRAKTMAKKVFLGNGLSRTAMVFKVATIAGHKLTIPELNRIKDINPRALERVYDTVLGGVKKATRCLRCDWY